MAGFQDNLRAGGLIKGPLQVQPRTIGEVPFDIQGITGQTAVLHRVRNAAGTTLFSIDNDGNIVIAGSVTAVVNETLTGKVSLAGTLSVTGETALQSTLTVAGNTYFSGASNIFSALTVSNSPATVNL